MRIDDKLLNSAIYFYHSAEAAKEGMQTGGGFWVGMRMAEIRISGREQPVPIWATYAVTNKHVIDGGCRFARVNKHDGTTFVIESSPDHWTFAIDDDLAVAAAMLPGNVKIDYIPESRFVAKPESDAAEAMFGPGDEAAIIGRMITHDGRQRNRPIARLGNIAMMPDEEDPIQLAGAQSQLGYLVDCRSLSGTSGSAVIAYRTIARRGNTLRFFAGEQAWLLGVDCAHLPRWTDVYEEDRLTKTGYQVEMNRRCGCGDTVVAIA